MQTTLVNKVPVNGSYEWLEYYRLDRVIGDPDRGTDDPFNADDLNDWAYSLRDGIEGRPGRRCVSMSWVDHVKPDTATLVLRCVLDV